MIKPAFFSPASFFMSLMNVFNLFFALAELGRGINLTPFQAWKVSYDCNLDAPG